MKIVRLPLRQMLKECLHVQGCGAAIITAQRGRAIAQSATVEAPLSLGIFMGQNQGGGRPIDHCYGVHATN
jgi:hypothetical protein